jgi:flagellar export protein FliJ
VKAFTFRLEKALGWRETQLDLQKSRAAAAAARAAGIQTLIDAQAAEAANAAAQLTREPTAIALASYASFLQMNRNRTRQLGEQLTTAKHALALELQQLVEANRKARLLEKLKSSEQEKWRKELDRDIARFADEAFLTGIQSRKRTGA